MREMNGEGILAGLDAALEYCHSLELHGPLRSTRFREYRERVAALVETRKTDGLKAERALYSSDHLSYVVALSEAGEMAILEPFLRTCAPEVVRPKLAAVLGGPVLPNEEDQNSNHARNILFELSVAQNLALAGLNPTLGDAPDLTCAIDGIRFLIECKRPLTRRGARDRIVQARGLLDGLVAMAPATTRGLVALSITKLINPGDLILRCANHATALAIMRSRVRTEGTELGRNNWAPDAFVGILFHAMTPTFLEDRRQMVVHQTSYGVGWAAFDVPNGFAVLNFLDRFNKSAY